MKDAALAIMTMLFQILDGFGDVLANTSFLGSTVFPIINSVAVVIKPIGYALLAVFALLEFAQLSEKMGNINGFAGTGLVIEVLIKIVLCKLVVDNSTEICQFVLGITESISQRVSGSTTFSVITQSQLRIYMENVFPDWYDPLGQAAMGMIIVVFCILTMICLAVVYVVFYARIIEMYVFTAVSPIPLSTCLSKSFNIAPNYIKNLFAIGLQGTLLILVVKMFSVLILRELGNVINGTSTASSILSFLVSGSSSFSACLHLLISTLFMSILMLVCSMQTQKWAKSICHAI